MFAYFVEIPLILCVPLLFTQVPSYALYSNRLIPFDDNYPERQVQYCRAMLAKEDGNYGKDMAIHAH